MEQALAGGGAEIEPEAGVVTAGVEAGTGVRNEGKIRIRFIGFVHK